MVTNGGLMSLFQGRHPTFWAVSMNEHCGIHYGI